MKYIRESSGCRLDVCFLSFCCYPRVFFAPVSFSHRSPFTSHTHIVHFPYVPFRITLQRVLCNRSVSSIPRGTTPSSSDRSSSGPTSSSAPQTPTRRLSGTPRFLVVVLAAAAGTTAFRARDLPMPSSGRYRGCRL